MSKTRHFNFTVDKEERKVIVERKFDAPVNLVWEAWTKPELLDRWWAPKPWRSSTKYMDFRPGGRRLYAMRGPEGEEHWALAEYTSVTPRSNFRFLDAFCDVEGNIKPHMPRSDWSITFKETEGDTLVLIESTHMELSDLEKLIEMGFREGFTIALEGLDELLATL